MGRRGRTSVLFAGPGPRFVDFVRIVVETQKQFPVDRYDGGVFRFRFGVRVDLVRGVHDRTKRPARHQKLRDQVRRRLMNHNPMRIMP